MRAACAPDFGQGGAAIEGVSVLGTPPAKQRCLYRSNRDWRIGTITVPTLSLGRRRRQVGPDAVRHREFVSAAYAMEVLPSVGHFVMDQAAPKATELLLAHLRKHPV